MVHEVDVNGGARLRDRGREQRVDYIDLLGVHALKRRVMLALELLKEISELFIVRLVREPVAEDLAHEVLQLVSAF